MGRHENLSKILQETVDSCVEKIGFRKDGINTSPMLNTTFASMDWDARVLNRSKRFNGSYNFCRLWYIGRCCLQMLSVKSSTTDTRYRKTHAWREKNSTSTQG